MNAFQVGVATLAELARDKETVEDDIRLAAAQTLAALNEHGRGALEHVEVDNNTVTINVEVDRSKIASVVAQAERTRGGSLR